MRTGIPCVTLGAGRSGWALDPLDTLITLDALVALITLLSKSVPVFSVGWLLIRVVGNTDVACPVSGYGVILHVGYRRTPRSKPVDYPGALRPGWTWRALGTTTGDEEAAHTIIQAIFWSAAEETT